MNHKDMPNVEELKAFAILQEALALGASYANRPDRGNGRTKIKRGFEAVATLKAALARRPLPSPEAGGADQGRQAARQQGTRTLAEEWATASSPKTLVLLANAAEDLRTTLDLFNPSPEAATPIPMVLHCPACSTQHIDEVTETWANPPHRSHLCGACGHIWRPADVPTVGVKVTQTRGEADSPSPEAGGGNPHHWTPNQSTGGNWRCTKCGLATMEIASSATPERCSVIVASPPSSPEAGVREAAWLVERDGKWLRVKHTDWEVRQALAGDLWRENWTSDANTALRFARREDAEAMIRKEGLQNAKATEHLWIDALARRSLPSPEAGGDEFDHDTGKLRLPPHKPAGTPEEIAAAIADLKAKLDADHKSRRLAPEAGGAETALAMLASAPQPGELKCPISGEPRCCAPGDCWKHTREMCS